MRSTVQLSFVSPTGYTASTCGYCTAPGSGKRSSDKSSRSYGFWAHHLSPHHYQSLIDRGWRRSGSYVYKPDLLRTCCAQIPIRLDVRDFRPKKSHRRALINVLFQVRQTKPKPAKWKGRWSRDRAWNVEQRWDEIVPPETSRTQASSSSSSSTWADRVAGPITSRLQVSLALAATSDEKYQLFRKYQASVHGESDQDISSEQGFRRFLVDTSLTLTWPSSGDTLSPTEELQWRAKSFDAANLPDELPYGCYHQEYRLDDKLIAVGVLDILPECVSSVYVFYDPEYKEWQLGKVSALQEIALTRRLGRSTAMSAITRYYMGFYIHTCQKMKYKAEYRPSQVLDCHSNTWRNLAEVTPHLDAKRHYGWTEGEQSLRDQAERAHSAANSGMEEDDEEGDMRVPTKPKPPPGMLDATAMLSALDHMLKGSSDMIEPSAGVHLLQYARVLEAEKQAEGVKSLFRSNILREFLQSRPPEGGDDDDGSELVQVVECVAALASAELVAEMIFFV
ncbi:Arginyl-tRNA--protein transferase 1 [Pseudozyma hubeiensis]|nr:Arginyl-tRNA--protein transferase 1 [Pseudozyma hubeiensis]